MLLGRSEGKVDDKGRITVPAIFRSDLESGATLYLTLGDVSELAIWPEPAFNQKLAEYKARESSGPDGARDFRRFTSHAVAFILDDQHRLGIPERMRTRAGISLKGAVACIGSLDRIEIWDPIRLDAYLEPVG